MRTLTTIVLICTLLAIGCGTTKPQRAQKYLDKAISFDSSIIRQTQKETIVFKDSVRVKDSTIYHIKDSLVLIPKTVLSETQVIPDTVIKTGIDTAAIDSINKILQDKDLYIRQLEARKMLSPSVIESIRKVETIKEVGHKVLDLVIGMFSGVIFVMIGAAGRRIYSYFKNRIRTKASA